jgi:cyclophilin family peptidyl-prolyl cis-trans isomerase
MKRQKRFARQRLRTARRRNLPRMRQLEWLEPRAMLAGTPLGTVTDTLATAGQSREISLNLAGAAEPVALSLDVRPTNGSTFDPAAVRVLNQSGTQLTTILSQNGVNGAVDSRVTIELTNGVYDVLVGGENNTTGNYELRVFFAGDETGNQQVTQQEYAMASAAALQAQFGINHVAARVFAKQGVDVSQNLYRTEFDINGNGMVDEFDRNIISMNQGAPAPTVTLSADQQAPQIQASLSNDTGRSNTDGITNDLNATINGSISDNGTIASFTASIDGSTPVELGTLLGQSFANGGNFSLTLAQLESIAGTGAGSLTNDGAHTLRLVARDEKDNAATPVEVSFTFDTQAPPAPTGLDLAAGSDSGSSNTDNITNDTTPTIDGTADPNARVQLFSSLATGAIGQMDVTTGAFSITPTNPLAAGTHSITATATDLAGNVSQASTALSVVIDTTAPETLTLTLDPASDTGTVGDNLTTNTTVTLQGTTEANANVTLRRGGNVVATATANSSGAFSFTQVTLPFGATPFEVTAMDAAGGTRSFTRTITRNDAPVATDATLTLAEESPVGTVVDTVSASDPNSTEGDTLTYAITAGNTGGAFAIDPNNGQIRVANSAAVDFETTPVFTLTVTVTDAGGNGSGTAGTGLTDTATITINLSDGNDAPIIANQTFQIAENSANDTSVGTVQATDPNAGNTVTFAITAGNTNGAFAIDANTGQITVANSTAVNFEATASFALTVSATDNLGLARTATITVNVQNVNEAPTFNDVTFDVPTSATAQQIVGTMTATDPDAGENHSFVVLESNTPPGLFTVSLQGVIAVSNPTLLVAGSMYMMTIRVTDQGGNGLNDTGTVTINVGTNTAPTAVGDVFQLTQNNTNVGLTVLANDTDPDAGQTLSVINIGPRESGGTATLGPNGQTIVYTPPTGFIGTDRFTYTVSDGLGGTTQSLATVQVMAPMPALTASFQANLSIFINGERRPNPPANIGVMSPGAAQTLLAPIHTEAADGRLHIEPSTSGPPAQSVTVNDFFTTWRTNAGAAGNNPNAIFTANQVLDHVRAADEVVRMYVNGQPVDALGNHIIRPEDQIVISVEKTGAVNRPTFVPIADQTVLVGSPLIIPLEGFDPNSTSLTFEATSANTNVVDAEIPQGNDSMVLTVQNFGQLTYELLEGHVPAITSQMIALANSGVLDNTPIHRVINGFVFQGLDPTGTGGGHPALVNFDDQYHVDLQHNSSGLLSMAKVTDDTNSSQIFSTDVNPSANQFSVTILRRLDFNHSIFAKQTSGENVRRLIMPVPTTPDNPADPVPDNRPLTDIVVQDVAIRRIGDKAVLLLKAPTGATGTTDVTITASDQQGNEFSQTFTVTVQPDTFNGSPFLSNYPNMVETTENTAVNVQVQVTDAENDPNTIGAVPVGLSGTILFDNTGDETGITTPGTTDFSHLGANWSGGTVTTTTTAPLPSQGSGAYVMGANGRVEFAQPINQARFFFVHQTGQGPFTARAFAGNTEVGMVSSNLLTNPANLGNFEQFVASGITRIEFTGGHVDNFSFVAQPVQSALQVNQDTDTVTVTPPSGFVGWMAIRVAVQQNPGIPVDANAPATDEQVIRIRVNSAGTSAALTADDDGGDVDEDAVDEVFDELGTT